MFGLTKNLSDLTMTEVPFTLKDLEQVKTDFGAGKIHFWSSEKKIDK